MSSSWDFSSGLCVGMTGAYWVSGNGGVLPFTWTRFAFLAALSAFAFALSLRAAARRAL